MIIYVHLLGKNKTGDECTSTYPGCPLAITMSSEISGSVGVRFVSSFVDHDDIANVYFFVLIISCIIRWGDEQLG